MKTISVLRTLCLVGLAIGLSSVTPQRGRADDTCVETEHCTYCYEWDTDCLAYLCDDGAGVIQCFE